MPKKNYKTDGIENPCAFPDPLRAFNSLKANPSNAGMTLRDYFAAAALTGYIGSERLELESMAFESEETIATICFQFADAMLKERAES